MVLWSRVVVLVVLVVLATIIEVRGFRPMPITSRFPGLKGKGGLALDPLLERSSSIRPPCMSRSILASASGAAADPGKKKKTIGDYWDAFYKFTRPHTIRGTILASVMGVTRCLIEHPSYFSLAPLPKAVLGMLALMCGNIFIVGINQIYDVPIDKVNKPYLPLAADKMSTELAWVFVVLSCALGVTITKLFFSNLIFGMYSAGLVAGAVYSIPPFYFKRFPLIAALTIAFVRGFSLNFGVYYAVRESLNIPFKLNPIVLFITRFMTVFAAVIAVSKDLPDVEGDIKYNVNTFAARVGVKNIAKGATAVLFLNYLAAVVEGIINPGKVYNRVVMVLGHTILGLRLLLKFRTIDTSKMEEIKKYYAFIWELFYLEYCMYPFL